MSEMRTLHCEAGNHTWERPSQRGRLPRNCPEHAAQATAPREATPAAAPTIDYELVDLYRAESSLPREVIAAFVAANMEPPSTERVDRTGYTPAERILLDKHYDKYEPHGPRETASV